MFSMLRPGNSLPVTSSCISAELAGMVCHNLYKAQQAMHSVASNEWCRQEHWIQDEGPFILGKQISYADGCLFPTLTFMVRTCCHRTQPVTPRAEQQLYFVLGEPQQPSLCLSAAAAHLLRSHGCITQLLTREPTCSSTHDGYWPPSSC